MYLDVSDREAWQAACKKIIYKFKKLDVLVNNAGVIIAKDIEDVSLEEWYHMVSVHMTSVFLGTKICAPFLRRAGTQSKAGSAIVNISSVSGLVAAPLDPLYSMTKGGVTLFTKSTAITFANKGDRIRVNAVHLGVIDTQMGRKTVDLFADRNGIEGDDERVLLSAKRHPIGRIGTTTDVAQAVLYLSSDASAFATGSSLIIDGGLTAQ